MENTSFLSSTTVEPALSQTWLGISEYQPYFIGAIFALNALLSLGYLIYLLRYRAYNHMGGLISGTLLLIFLFSTSRSLLIAQPFSVPEIHQTLQILDCIRTVSICSIFGLAFTTIVRSCEPNFTQTYTATKIACFLCILVNYGLAAAPTVLQQFPSVDQLIPKATQVAVDMYFMTLLFIMAFAYIFILPKTLAMGRSAKATADVTAPKRIVTAALLGLLSAVLALGYVTLLVARFLTESLKVDWGGTGTMWREWGHIFRHVYIIGISAAEAILTGLLVICTALLIKSPDSLASTEVSPVSGPEGQGLLYPGRNTINAPAYHSATVGRNGYQPISLYKADK